MSVQNHVDVAKKDPPLECGGNGGVPDSEVSAKASRRRFGAAYKLKVLEEVDKHPDQAGAILRREGLYSSHLANWRRERRDGTLLALGGKKRGRKGKSQLELENARLSRENTRLMRELEKARIILDAQKKFAEIFGVDLPKIIGRNEVDE